MTSPASAAVADTVWNASVANAEDLHRVVDRLRVQLAELEPVVSAAVLAASAFRLRDEEGLTAALRLLADSIARLEESRPAP